tara:strand:+ start:1589 stop:1720 length:132 start_codon:yes stop_codon:yes gene_type:complete
MEEFKNQKEIITKIHQLKKLKPRTLDNKLLIQKLQQKLDELQN